MDAALGEALNNLFDPAFEKRCKYVCDVPGCGRTFVKNNFLEFHIRTHTNERPFRCTFDNCARSYTRSWHLRRHIKKSHETNRTDLPKFVCTYSGCVKLYKSQDALKKHYIKAHEQCLEVRTSKYDECPVSHIGLSKHKLKKHSLKRTAELPFKCSVNGCQKEYRVRKKLEAHEKLHASFKCEICDGQSFQTWSDLRKHNTAVHSTKRCPKCDRTFKSNCMNHITRSTLPALLRAHLATHEEERPAFICPEEGCEKSYFELKNLRAHQRAAHEGVRYSCSECQKEFRSKQGLRRHGRKCLIKDDKPKAPRTGLARKSRIDKGVPRKDAAMWLAGLDRCEEVSRYPTELFKPKLDYCSNSV